MDKPKDTHLSLEKKNRLLEKTTANWKRFILEKMKDDHKDIRLLFISKEDFLTTLSTLIINGLEWIDNPFKTEHPNYYIRLKSGDHYLRAITGEWGVKIGVRYRVHPKEEKVLFNGAELALLRSYIEEFHMDKRIMELDASEWL